MILDIDKHLPRGLKWNIKTMKAVGSNGCEYGQFWHRNTLDGINKLCEDPTFKDLIQWRPTREWTSPACETRKYNETMASNRMWNLQKMHPDKHATLIPTFFASDETALTAYVGDQKAHCVYMTIGNIPKHIRRQVSKRAMILVGYIPVMSLECEPDLEKRALLKRKLFHECMRALVEPLIEAGKRGAEACKYACTRQPYCPTCEVPPDERGDLTDYPLRDRARTLDAIAQHRREGSALFESLGLMDVKPFWADLPWVDAGTLCPPDLLHQLYKGVFNHLSKWSAHIEGAKVFDNRYVVMSPHHGLRHFKKGITKISRWTGHEAKEQCKVFLPIVADQDPEVMSCARALMRFMYLAHSSELTDDDLDEMQACIEEFHENKDIFRQLGALGEQDPKKKKGPVRTFHMVAKLHALLHYIHYIRELGTPDGFNTELPERLHIPYAKHGFHASNKKDVIKQMATYIQRIEAIAMHRAYLDDESTPDTEGPSENPDDEDGSFEEDEVLIGELHQLVLGAEGEPEGDDHADGDDDSVGGGVGDDSEERQEDESLGGAVIEDELEVDDNEDLEPSLERRDTDNGTWAEEYHIDDETGQQDSPSVFYPEPHVKHSKKPTLVATATHLVSKHGASKLFPAIKSFLRQQNLGTRDLNLSANDKYRIWNRCRLIHGPPPFKPTEGGKTDVIRAFPAVIDEHGRPRKEAHYDTALFAHDEEEDGLHRYRACRIRAIFELPDHLQHLYDKKLVYAELFNSFHESFDVRTHLYKTTPSNAADGRRLAIVMPLSDIKFTGHIAPHYGSATAELSLPPFSFLNLCITGVGWERQNEPCYASGYLNGEPDCKAQDRESDYEGRSNRQRQPSVSDRVKVKVEVLNEHAPTGDRLFPNQGGSSSLVASRYDPCRPSPPPERQAAEGRSPYMATPSQLNTPYPGYWERDRERGAPPKAPSRQQSPAPREREGPPSSRRYDPRMDIDQESPRHEHWPADLPYPTAHPLDRMRYNATPDGGL
ncbi:unnamed protein product [Rhizoctonia solani]|uniref:Uncharacterized protein n=1 Tax=Rhizoctonia solani TaxID=456999 RepID=A0A8H3DID6_9AGAM|nr:unnamed protein product [Rhizoctonia solani]